MRKSSWGATALACTLGLLGSGLSGTASADTGEWNLHLEPGVSLALAGDWAETSSGDNLGPSLAASVDWGVLDWLAIEAQVGGGALLTHPASDEDLTPMFNVGAGVRIRPLDDDSGYADEGGSLHGNLWVAAHAGFYLFDGPQFGVDAAVGYELSVARPVSVGLFVRGAALVEGDRQDLDFVLTGGLSVSVELVPRAQPEPEAPRDSDGDTLLDTVEVNETHTDPNMADTDGDGLRDDVEVAGPTDPHNPDSDGDGLMDGAEDADHDGVRGATESDPMVADTDEGGVPDGWEVNHQMDPVDPTDDDADRDTVLDNVDACLGTAEGTEVDARGCAVIRQEMVLEGITFATDSDEILPTSVDSLTRAAQMLNDNPEVAVEIAGHTDARGEHDHNLDLSERRARSVLRWLSERGVDASRLSTRGYGPDSPIADNNSDEGRAQNRRIEFRRQ